MITFSLQMARQPWERRAKNSYDEFVEQFLHVGRHFAFKRQSVAFHGVNEPQMRGMQGLALETQRCQHAAVRWTGAAIDRIAEQRMADRGHVDADLVGPSSLQAALDQGGFPKLVKVPPMRGRVLALS